MSSSPIAVLLPHGPVTCIAPAAVTEHEEPGLLAVLAAVPDPRDPRGVRYPLASVLAVAVCAVLAGAVTFAAIADWVRDLDSPAWARLGFTDRIPVASTVWRLLAARASIPDHRRGVCMVMTPRTTLSAEECAARIIKRFQQRYHARQP